MSKKKGYLMNVNVNQMSEKVEHYYSITISNSQLNIIKNALLTYHENVIANPHKNFDIDSMDVLKLLKWIDDKNKWKTF